MKETENEWPERPEQDLQYVVSWKPREKSAHWGGSSQLCITKLRRPRWVVMRKECLQSLS